MDDLKVTSNQLNAQIAAIYAEGYIDTVTVPEIEKVVQSVVSKGIYKIIVDLSKIDYVSSAGWGVFVSELKDIRSNSGDLVLIGMTPEVYDVYELMEFSSILKSFDSLNDAVSAFGITDFETAGLKDPSKGMTKGEQPTASSVNSGATTSTANAASFQGGAVNPAMLSLDEKIQHIVKANPAADSTEIKNILQTSKYGNEKLGLFNSVAKILKKLDLDTPEKRKKYASSI